MKPIEETHPSLSITEFINDESMVRYTMRTMERLLEDVQKHTVDKQVLKASIMELIVFLKEMWITDFGKEYNIIGWEPYEMKIRKFMNLL